MAASRHDALAVLLPEAADDELRLARGLIDIARGRSVDAPVDRLPMSFVRHHRVVPALPRSWVPADQQASVDDLRSAIMLLQMRLEWGARRAAATLAEVGIDVRVLKGVAAAHLDHPDPSVRHSGDVDLLVPPGRLADAMRALAAAGATIPARQTLRRWSRGLTVIDDGVHIDLHVRLLQRRPRRDRLFAQPTPLPLAGLYALPGPARVAHAAVHVVATRPHLRRLSGLLDVAASVDRYDLDEIRAHGSDLRAERLVEVALAAVTGADVPRVSPLERRAFLEPDSSRAASAIWHHGLALAWRAPQTALARRRPLVVATSEATASSADGRHEAAPTAPTAPSASPITGRWRRHPDVGQRNDGAGILLWQPHADDAVALDETAATLWQLLDTEVAPAGLLEHFAGSDRERMSRQLDGFLRDLASRGFIERAPEARARSEVVDRDGGARGG